MKRLLPCAGGQPLAALPVLTAVATRRPGSPPRVRGRLPVIEEDSDGAACGGSGTEDTPACHSAEAGDPLSRIAPQTPPPPGNTAAGSGGALSPFAQQPGDRLEGADLETLEEALDSAFDRWCGGGSDAGWSASPSSPSPGAPPPPLPYRPPIHCLLPPRPPPAPHPLLDVCFDSKNGIWGQSFKCEIFLFSTGAPDSPSSSSGGLSGGGSAAGGPSPSSPFPPLLRASSAPPAPGQQHQPGMGRDAQQQQQRALSTTDRIVQLDTQVSCL